MNDPTDSADPLCDLAGAICNGTASKKDLFELDSILLADEESCRRYLRYCQMHVALRLEVKADLAARKACRQIEIRPSVPALPDPGIPDDDASAPLPLAFLGNTTLVTGGHTSAFSSGWPVAYFVATVICGLGLLIASWMPVSQSVQVVRQSVPRPSPLASNPSARMQSVGRITGMVDCQWVQSIEPGVLSPALNPRLSSLVSLGDRFALASGLMEIAYDSGAKVILQGPCTYEVESRAGGFLSVGKLTANVEKKTHQSNPQSLTPNPSLPTTHYPLFTIKTPTATVMDLGTEFGVEVDKRGTTTSHVFRGSVQLAVVKGGSAPPMILAANESARVEIGVDHLPLMRRISADREGFVCKMPLPPARLLLRDTYDNPADSNAFDDGGLNHYLRERQFGLCRPVSYLRGGDFADRIALAQVAHPVCLGKLSLFTNHGSSGWLVLDRIFVRDIVVSATLDPVAMRLADQSLVPKAAIGDLTSENWMALAVRGAGIRSDRKELPLASDAGAVIRVQSNGNWDYFENGMPIAHGRVSPAHPYAVVMRALGDQLEISINGDLLDLDPNGAGTTRALRGQAAETRGNFVSLGAGSALTPADSTEIDLNSVDDLTIIEARPGALTAIVPPRPDTDSKSSDRKEPPDTSTAK
jgi:hypothetical protein